MTHGSDRGILVAHDTGAGDTTIFITGMTAGNADKQYIKQCEQREGNMFFTFTIIRGYENQANEK